MGDDRWKYDVPEEARDEPVTRKPVPQSRQSASERLVRLAKPLLARTGAFARTLPGHAHDLVERIDMPRRIADTRQWIEAQHFPDKAARLRSNLQKAGRGAADVSRRSLTATQAKAGPILTAAGEKMASGAQAVSGRATALSETLAARRADVAARKATRSAREATEAADAQPKPVPSELIRLLKEQGVTVEGDVRQALPGPVRLDRGAVQGALPLFTEEPPPAEIENAAPLSAPPSPPAPEPIPPSDVQPAQRTDPAQPPSVGPRTSSKKVEKTFWRGLFTRTDDPSFLQNRKFQMTIGATAFIAAAAAAGLMIQGGTSSSVASEGTSASGNMNRAQIETIVHDYILAHPEIIPQAIERLQAKRTASLVDRHRTELETPFAGGWEGAKDGDVVLVEFFDYACGYCKASLPDIDRLLSEDKGLKVVYRELPILSDESGQAAKASLYAAKQGKYGRFHRALYGAGQLSKESIEAAAKQAGLDPATVKAAQSASDINAEIDNNVRLAQALQATGTPTWVVGDQVLSGAVGYDALKAAIEKARAGR